MKKIMNYDKHIPSILLMGFSLLMVGCSSVMTRTELKEVGVSDGGNTITTVQRMEAQGVADYVWEEPMIDVVDVPPGLDPEGHYYRPAHQAIVEIRQGRWQHYRAASAAKDE